ncbi:MAG: T9SS C-terminal target domain-containing protein [Balneola sp.]|nr:MAG: T9SS C-terminal target domain-containing protein [Balneola sp.]
MKKYFLLFSILLFSISVKAQTDLIAPTLLKQELISFLQENYSVTNQQSYNAARDAMFEDIDGKSGMISCVYTGYTISFTNRQDAQGTQQAGDFNTEHIWPQSFFDSDLPMRSDIHHLFPTRVDVNGARSNFRFDEIPDDQTTRWYRGDANQADIPSSNIDEFSELGSERFEPREDLKGNVARAIFYFWTIYQDNSSITTDNTDNEAFFEGMKEVLLLWHNLDPVDSLEVARSLEIEEVQGNQNPFIHDTTLVRRAYFDGVAISNEPDVITPSSIKLFQNYPNPFNPNTLIRYELASSGFVSLKVFDAMGREVANLVERPLSKGLHTAQFDATGLSSGIYVYQLRVGEEVRTSSMLLIK